MPTLKRITIALFLLFTFHTVRAQELTNKITAPATAPVITGTASAERVRFTAPGTVVQMQLQIYDASGQLLFDVTSKGNVLDWTLQDSGGERIAPGSYLCLVTVKSLSGKLSQRIGQALVQEKQVELQRVDATQLTGAQQQAVGPIEENGALTILKAGEAEATTVLANNGKEGQMIRDRGALTFRIGDFFSGNDTEQMRLTEEGNLGVGTSKPKFKLDVAGAVRARQGFVFNDGSTLNVNDKGALTLTDSNGTAVPNVSGTGTTGLLTKWTDGANGTLGDSVVTELNGNIGVSNPNPTAKLVVDASSSSELRFDQGIGGVTPVLSVISQPGSTTQGGASILGAGTGGSSFVFSDNLPFFLVKDTKANVINNNLGHGTILFTLLPTGNVGIGTTNPASSLDVAGNINTSTQYNIGGNRVLGVSGAGNSTSNTFTGLGAGASTTPGVGIGGFNSFFGNSTGNQNTTGSHNSFFGTSAGFSNTMGNENSFFGFLAGDLSMTGASNTFIGSHADFNANNPTGDQNTLLGGFTAVNSGVSNSTAIGYRATVTQSNSLILGSINGVNGASADTNVGIGTTAPSSVLHLVGSQPPPVATTNGTNAAPVLQIFGGKGGTSTASPGSGGAGASLLAQAGDGGDGSASAANFGGPGGSIMLKAGNGGGGPGGGCGGCNQDDGGSISLQAGTGGTSGIGGSITLQTGKSFGGGSNPSGNVGIGMQPPQVIRGPFGSLGGNALFIANESGDAGNSFRIDVEKDNLYLVGRSDSGATADTGIIFRTSPAGGAGIAEFDRMAINGNGKVGIGTTSPASVLHLNGNSSNFALTFTNQANTAGRRGYRIAFDNDRLTFQQADDSGNFAANQMAIDQATGNVGIGTSAPPSHKLEVNGSVAGVGPYQDISDARYKKNIFTLTGALDKILRLRGVSYDWRREENPAINFNSGRQVGFIAQEVEKVLPEAVTKDEKGSYRLAYSAVVPLLVEAIKQQQQTITELQEERRELQAVLTAQQARLAALEHIVRRTKRQRYDTTTDVLARTITY